MHSHQAHAQHPNQARESSLAAAAVAAPAGAPAAAPATAPADAMARLPPSSLSRSNSPRPKVISTLASPERPKVLRSADLLREARGATASSLSPKVLCNVRGDGGGGGERDASPSWNTAEWSPFSTPRGVRAVEARSGSSARPDAARPEPARKPRSVVARGLERQLATAVDGAAVSDGAAPHAVAAAALREPGPSPAVTTSGGSAASTALPLNPRMLARRSSSGLERMEAGVFESEAPAKT